MLTSSSNVTEIPELSPTYSIYDAEIGPAVWQVDIGLGVLFSICLVLALLGNAVILFLLARYKPYIRYYILFSYGFVVFRVIAKDQTLVISRN